MRCMCRATLKVHLHGMKSDIFSWRFLSLSLLNVNIKLDSLWTHLEGMSLSFRSEWTSVSPQCEIESTMTGGLMQHLKTSKYKFCEWWVFLCFLKSLWTEQKFLHDISSAYISVRQKQNEHLWNSESGRVPEQRVLKVGCSCVHCTNLLGIEHGGN